MRKSDRADGVSDVSTASGTSGNRCCIELLPATTGFTVWQHFMFH
jgi:hypothetical protein